MQPDKKYKFDAFISYNSADWPWAKSLADALEQEGVEPFLDRLRLQAGATWERQLQEALRISRHLVVLWSDKARDSDWMRRELGLFEGQIDIPVPGQRPSERRIFFLPLEGEHGAYTSLQMITDLRDENAYAGSADQVEPALWKRVARRLREAIFSDDPPPIDVPLAILTMTREQFLSLDPEEKPSGVKESLGDYLRSIGIESKDELTQYYAPERKAWRPFENRQDIWTTLEVLLEEDINKKLEGKSFRWDLIEEAFWSEEFETEVDKLKGDSPSVVIVDLVALYDHEIRERVKDLSHELRESSVLFMTLLPLQCWGVHGHVRDQLRSMVKPLFDHLYDPRFGRDSSQARWSCDVNIADEMDIRRTLLPVLGRHLVDDDEPPSEFFRFGGSRS
jgi:hypothetical protein